MSKGRISKRNLLARLPLMAAVAFVCFPHVAKAQQGNPEIFIDMSVLQGLGPTPTQPQQPIKLRPPALKPPASTQPQLIAPTTTQTQTTPAYTPPSKPATPQVKNKAYVSKPPEIPAGEVRRAISSPQQSAPASAPLKSAPPPVMPEAVAVKETVAVPPIPVVENTKPAAAPVPKPVVFPVKTKVRTEITDPAATASSRPVPVRSGIAGNLNDTVLSRPAPDFDPTATSDDSIPVRDLTEEPEVAATPDPVKTASAKPAVVPGRKPSMPQKTEEKAPEKIADTSTPPVTPPHRPEVQKAPPELVAELRAREAAKLEAATTTKAPSVDLADPPPPPGPRGKKNMPAVAKAPVESEKLAEQLIKLPANSDPLLDRLVEKDKQDLVATIESMVSAREDGKPLPENKKTSREQGSNIVRAEPMQRPYNVYRPKKEESATPAIEELVTAKVEEKIETLTPLPAPEDTKVATIEKAAPAADVITPRPPPPGNQDEQAYVSVPFSAGLTEVDAKITGEIESRLLPVLNDNPGWKLQIQAFASPVKDGVSSARKASLARAMSVRSYLLSKGIEATRMDIRALGAESDRDPMDRVDLIVFDPAKKS